VKQAKGSQGLHKIGKGNKRMLRKKVISNKSKLYGFK